MDREVIAVAAADLEYLRGEWGDNITDDALRRGSVTLRQLLVNGVYAKAWREAGIEQAPTVNAPNLDRSLDRKKDDLKLSLGLAGGGIADGLELVFGCSGPTGGAPEPREDEIAWRFPIWKFLNSTGLVVMNKRVPRQAVIQYVANKLGGAHLDKSREKTGQGPAYELLDRHAAQMIMQGKNMVYFELMSIGQHVGRSADAAKLIDFRKSMK